MKKHTGLKLIAVAALAVLLLGSVACFPGGRLVWVTDTPASAQEPTEPTGGITEPIEQPTEPTGDTNEPIEQPTDPADETEESPVRKSGKSVLSAKELSLYDVVSFGRYIQTEMGSETPIEWYVIKIDGNKVRLMSKYCLDSCRYHSGKVDMVEFEDSELYRWLNKEFKKDAFSDEESRMLTNGVTLLDRSEANKLPMECRKAKATEYAIEVRGFNEKKDFWWLGESCEDPAYVWDENTWEYLECYCAYAMKGNGEDIWSFDMTFHGKGVRPVITIQF